jgi:hypothetical protein
LALALSSSLLTAAPASDSTSGGAGDIKPAEPEKKLTTTHWSYQPLHRPDVPPITGSWARGPIDSFLETKLREKHLEPSAAADRRTLIRRLFLVMHGLLPSPERVEAFVKDTRPDAYEKLVDEVLASPHYGERWARHWLDVARYADSNGFETNRERKSAWPYRDWVIEAFNNDKPWDQFIREQLAGDALGADAGTGFLVAGQYDIVKSPDINLSLAQREDELADMVNTTGTAFLGLTMGCARCHNHKFDPIPQKDYFAMQAVFAGVSHGERPLRKKPDPADAKEAAALRETIAQREAKLENFRQTANNIPDNAPGSVPLRPTVTFESNTEEFPPVDALAVRFTITASTGAEPCIDELEVYGESGRNLALASTGAVAEASGTLPGYNAHKLDHLNDGLTGNEHSWISTTPSGGWARINFPSATRIQRVVWSRDRPGKFRDRLATGYRLEALVPSTAAPASANTTTTGAAVANTEHWITLTTSSDRQPFAGGSDPDAIFRRLPKDQADTALALKAELSVLRSDLARLEGGDNAWLGTFSQPGPTHRLQRGDPMQPREVVAPGALTLLGNLGMTVDEPEQRRRLRLGEWIANPDNPLTARVLVNRLWHYIFGQGIVDTPSDLGVNGSRPTHPELLDWMASEFMQNGWSVKHMQRLILLSAAFQQSSEPRADGLKADADARLLWRFPPRRMEAEAIRDSMLAVSGALNPQAGGPGFYLMEVEEENVMHYHPKEKFTPAEFRRMVYQTRIRQTNDGVFRSFDCPDGSLVMPRRSRSNTPLQALNLFNSRFVLQQADLLAVRLQTDAGTQPADDAARAFQLFYGRAPDAFEAESSANFIRTEGLPAFCRALYNSSEFLFIF